MPSSLTRACLVTLGSSLVCALPVLAQEGFRPDAMPRAVRFARDTVFQSAVIDHRVLQVRAEIDTAAAGRSSRLTGRYAVYAVYPNRTRLVAARLDPARDAPSVSFVSAGDPAVMVLASFTGGSGRRTPPNYSFKMVVAEAEQFRTFTLEPDSGRTFATANVKGFERGPSGMFTLRFADGPSLRYRNSRLTLSTSAADR